MWPDCHVDFLDGPVDLQTTDPAELGPFKPRRILQLLKRPEFVASAEVTRWLDIWDGSRTS